MRGGERWGLEREMGMGDGDWRRGVGLRGRLRELEDRVSDKIVCVVTSTQE